jgi:hypothetical protein
MTPETVMERIRDALNLSSNPDAHEDPTERKVAAVLRGVEEDIVMEKVSSGDGLTAYQIQVTDKNGNAFRQKVAGLKVGDHVAIREKPGSGWVLDHIPTGKLMSGHHRREKIELLARQVSLLGGEALASRDLATVEGIFPPNFGDYLERFREVPGFMMTYDEWNESLGPEEQEEAGDSRFALI